MMKTYYCIYKDTVQEVFQVLEDSCGLDFSYYCTFLDGYIVSKTHLQGVPLALKNCSDQSLLSLSELIKESHSYGLELTSNNSLPLCHDDSVFAVATECLMVFLLKTATAKEYKDIAEVLCADTSITQHLLHCFSAVQRECSTTLVNAIYVRFQSIHALCQLYSTLLQYPNVVSTLTSQLYNIKDPAIEKLRHHNNLVLSPLGMNLSNIARS